MSITVYSQHITYVRVNGQQVEVPLTLYGQPITSPLSHITPPMSSVHLIPGTVDREQARYLIADGLLYVSSSNCKNWSSVVGCRNNQPLIRPNNYITVRVDR